jgi:hypothetical protein
MYFYVIMPVGSDKQFTEKKCIIQKVAQEKNQLPYFPFDRTSAFSFDIHSTLSRMEDAQFVMADLSMERPSCYFELGLAQALGKDVYLIAEHNTDIHQSHGRNLTRFYKNLQHYEQVISAVLDEAMKAKSSLKSETLVPS